MALRDECGDIATAGKASMSYKLAVLGATGMVGRQILEVLGERGFPVADIAVLASRASTGKEVSVGDRKLKAKDAEDFDFSTVSLTIMAVGEKAARRWAPKVLAGGGYLIDISAAFRTDSNAVLVSPEANPEIIEHIGGKRLLSVPGGAAALLTTVLRPVRDAAGLKRVTVTALLSASESGSPAMDELWMQTKGIFVNQPPEPDRYPRQIAFNLIPQAGDFRDDGQTDEEQRLCDESRQILGDDLRIGATCIQAPVFVGHSLAVHMELERPIAIEDLREVLREATGVVVVDNREEETFVTPIETVGEWATYVSRIREDAAAENGVAMWITGDNLRKAGALNAVMTGELLSRSGAFARRVEE